MNPEVIAQEYLIELDLKGKVNRNEKIDLQQEIKNAVIFGLEYKHPIKLILTTEDQKEYEEEVHSIPCTKCGQLTEFTIRDVTDYKNTK